MPEVVSAAKVLSFDAMSGLRHAPPPAARRDYSAFQTACTQHRMFGVYGLGWGDEAKGAAVVKLIDAIRHVTGRQDAVGMVGKMNGGANSGTTSDKLKCNVIPPGAKDRHIPFLVLTRGVVVDPLKIQSEMLYVKANGAYQIDRRLKLDLKLQMSDVGDRVLDLARELWRSRYGASLGSTGRGIGPAYEHEVAHDQIPYGIFLNEDNKVGFQKQLAQRLRSVEVVCRELYGLSPEDFRGILATLTDKEIASNQDALHAKLLTIRDLSFLPFYAGGTSFDIQAICDRYWAAGRSFAVDADSGRKLDYIVDVGQLAVHVMNDRKQAVIGAFGQGYFLDKRQGYAKGATSSHTVPAEMYPALNLPPNRYPIYVVGNFKGYETKVGNHYIPTHLDTDSLEWAKWAPDELGVVTRRQRGVGHADAAAIGMALAHGGADVLFLNKLDPLTHSNVTVREPLGGFAQVVREYRWDGPLKICVGYMEDGTGLFHRTPPEDDNRWTAMRPVYIELPGWDEPIAGATSWNELPEAAKRYVAVYYAAVIKSARSQGLQRNVFPDIALYGTGPDRGQGVTDGPSGADLYKYGSPIYDALFDRLAERGFDREVHTRSGEALDLADVAADPDEEVPGQ